MPILKAWLREQDFSMIWAAFTLAFFGFLCCSKFTYPGVHSFCPQFDLGTDYVSFICVRYVRSTLKLCLNPLRLTFLARFGLLLLPRLPRLTTLSSRGPLFSFQLGQLLTDQQSYAFLGMLHCTLVNPIIASRAIVFVSVQLLQRLLQAYPLTHSIPFVPLGR